MTASVGDHGIAQAVFTEEPAKGQTEAAIEQKTAKNDHGGTSDEQECDRQMACGEQNSSDHIGGDQHSGGGECNKNLLCSFF